MQAARIHAYGDPSVLVVEESPEPVLRPDDVLIRVHTAAVNPADWQFRRGYYESVAPLTFPAILGWDVAGTVARLGPEAQGFTTGERVFAMCEMGRDGAYAEFVAVQDAYVAPAPSTLSLEHCAAVPLAALTAWQALFDLGELKAGQSVLVTAAAGGVGQFAVQLTRTAGARVTAVARTSHHDRLRRLGADTCVDYTRTGWADALRGFDLVIDGAGGETRQHAWDVLRPQGILVAVAMPPPDAAFAAARGVRAATARVVPDGARLREIAAMLDAGTLTVAIDSELPLAEVAAAHARSESRQAAGKILLRISGDT